MPESDAELVRRYLAGDPSGFASLVERHERRVFNLSLRILGKEEDARDATQDAFLSALRKLAGFRGDAAFTTWMHRVTVNACYDLLRKRSREPMLRSVGEDAEPRQMDPPSVDHADEVVGTTDATRALAQVPIEFRVVLVLHDVQDVAVEDVARILHLPRIALAKAMGLQPRRDREPDRPAPASDGKT